MSQAQQCNLLLARLFPPMRWLHRVNRSTFRDDLMAAITGAIIVLPQGVAFAAIAGMPPEYGLYAAMVPAIIAALFGSSWHLVSGPTTAASIVLFASLSTMAEPSSEQYVALAITLTFMVGVIQIAMGMAKLGTLVNFISHSVVVGFTAGAAILIAAQQIQNFFGIAIPRGSDFHETLWHFATGLDELDGFITLIGVVTLISGILVRRYFPRFPYMVIAMGAGTAVSIGLNLYFGRENTDIATVGALPASLPPLSAPDLTLETLRELAPVALAATLLALTEAVSIARALAARSGQRLDGNQEFIGQGLSNVVGSFFSSYVATGSFNRSGVNYEAGARTPLAAGMAGILLIPLTLVVAPYAEFLPNAAMAGILFLVAWGLIDFHHIRQILQTSRSEAMIMGTTFLATLFLELEFAILMGVFLSLVVYLSRTSRPRIVSRVPGLRDGKRTMVTNETGLAECPQLKVIRIDGSLFFGAVPHVEEALQNIDAEDPERKHLLIVADGINFVDVAGAEMLAQEAERRRYMGGGLYLYGVKASVCATLRSGGYLDAIGDKNIYTSKTEALHDIVLLHLDPEICRGCDKRIFQECDQQPGGAGLAASAAASRGDGT
ncbi:sulfate permease, SulP family [Thiohalospira halophila DSM 15071]|uniref:Sulfate permease, SulP family n=1 Tax=Thiohalospira halophila DSM 15071 TaxID=1123397 RepID=A0A1I1UAY1_9GAMM|nr:SulP family inorganic anion transporter [Thiohalospira halophila]SFD65080.1 sulfate permease, SulP family [Thiohalospira halophila DSM 15071]